ncbi:MAG: hypothetical protein ACXWJM_11710 [Ramlibacter sp.]
MRQFVLLRLLRSTRLAALLFLLLPSAWAQDISYNASTSILTIPSVQVGGATYVNVTLLNVGNYTFTLQQATAQSITGAAAAIYDLGSAVLTLPSVAVGATQYAVTLHNTGDYTFSLQSASAIQTFVYYSKTAVGAQTATLANGTLNMDGLHLTGFIFGGSATDATGTLKYWASPWNNINQPKVAAMLFCTADNKLAYVLLQSSADDPGRIASNVVDLLGAIDAAPQYQGMAIYRNCSGTFSAAWNNDKPASDYYQWPDIFTTYSYAYVASQLNNAAIFRELGTPANQDTFLAITWKGGSPFEVWQ